MRAFLTFLLNLVRAKFLSEQSLAIENAALRQQLAVYQHGKKRPLLKPGDRALWALLSRWWAGSRKTIRSRRSDIVSSSCGRSRIYDRGRICSPRYFA